MPSILTRVNFSMQRMQLFYSGGTILRPSSRHGLSRFPSTPPPAQKKKRSHFTYNEKSLRKRQIFSFPLFRNPLSNCSSSILFVYLLMSRLWNNYLKKIHALVVRLNILRILKFLLLKQGGPPPPTTFFKFECCFQNACRMKV